MKKLILIFILAMACTSSYGASVQFFTNEANWLAAVQSVEIFNTNATNVALADEIASPPNDLDTISRVLTFQSSNTNLSHSLQLEAILQTNIQFSRPISNSLSIGVFGGGALQNDDWEIRVLDGPGLTAFAFDLVSNNEKTGETFSIFGSGDVLLGTLDESGIPTPGTDGNGFNFLGVISSDPITRMFFDDEDGSDNIGVANFRLAEAVVPEASSILLLSLAVVMGIFVKRTN